MGNALNFFFDLLSKSHCIQPDSDYLNQTGANTLGQNFLGKKLFVDNNFDKTLPQKYQNNVNIMWKRPFEFCNKPYYIKNGIDIEDVFQGDLGSCWILTCLIGLANKSTYFYEILNIFNTFDSENYNGRFTFYFFNETTKTRQKVEIDDLLPYDVQKKKLIFAQNEIHQDEFWPSLLEKAYCKFKNKSYKDADMGGNPVDVSKCLFNSKSTTFFTIGNSVENINKIENILKNFNFKDSIITCAHITAKKDVNSKPFEQKDFCVDGNVNKENDIPYILIKPKQKSIKLFEQKDFCDIKKLANSTECLDSIIKDHAYIILYFDYEKKLVKVKNPWGNRYEFSNQISNSRDLSNQGMIKSDGIWWMHFDDFVKYFNLFQLSYSYDSFQNKFYSNRSIQNPKYKLVFSKFLKSSDYNMQQFKKITFNIEFKKFIVYHQKKQQKFLILIMFNQKNNTLNLHYKKCFIEHDKTIDFKSNYKHYFYSIPEIVTVDCSKKYKYIVEFSNFLTNDIDIRIEIYTER